MSSMIICCDGANTIYSKHDKGNISKTYAKAKTYKKKDLVD